jgi:hypothetical protein
MFEDQTSKNTPPSNLPVEPEDMFAGVDNDVGGVPATAPQAAPVVSTPNALTAGLLKKKEPTAEALPSAAMPAAAMYEMKQPILGKILLAVFLAAILGGVGFGGWYFYNKFKNTSVSSTTGNIVTENVLPVKIQENPPTPEVAGVKPVEVVTTSVSSAEVSNSMNNDKILFGAALDSDKDGLDDVREKEIGTSPSNPDSDADGLSDSEEVLIWKTNPLKADTDSDGLKDGEEVKIWKTDPLNPDTDGDSYVDGKEVANGYNPLGAGKLFNIPTSTTSTVSAPAKTATTTKK